jgi:hypothetical protein
MTRAIQYPWHQRGARCRDQRAGWPYGGMCRLDQKQMKKEQVAVKVYDADFNPIDLYNSPTGKHDIKFTAPNNPQCRLFCVRPTR